MSRWIDADEFGRCLRNYRPYVDSGRFNAIQTEVNQVLDCIEYEIEDAPSIDIVRCKECRHWEMRNSPRGWCVVHQGYVLPQYFCADGEREGE